jgi:hypothetical protein
MIEDSKKLEKFSFFFSHVDTDVKIQCLTAKLIDIFKNLNEVEKTNVRLV